MSRFFRITPRRVMTPLSVLFASSLFAFGPSAAAQPVVPVLPEGCVTVDENGVCVLTEAQMPVLTTPEVPAQEPVLDTPAPESPPAQVEVVSEPSEVAYEGQPAPESDTPGRGRPDDRGEDGHDDHDDGYEGDGSHDDDHDDSGGHDDGNHDDHDGGPRDGHDDDNHGGPGGGKGGHDDDDDHGDHGGKPRDDHGDHGGKPRDDHADDGDYTETNTNTETNVSVDVKIPITIVDNSVTDNSTHIDNSVTVIEKNTTVTEVTNTTVQETYVQIDKIVYSEQLLYLPEYDRYVLACEYDGRVEVTAWYPQGVSKHDLPSHQPTRRLPEFQGASTGGQPVAEPVMTTANSQNLWLPVGGVATVLLGLAGFAGWRRFQRRG